MQGRMPFSCQGTRYRAASPRQPWPVSGGACDSRACSPRQYVVPDRASQCRSAPTRRNCATPTRTGCTTTPIDACDPRLTTPSSRRYREANLSSFRVSPPTGAFDALARNAVSSGAPASKSIVDILVETVPSSSSSAPATQLKHNVDSKILRSSSPTPHVQQANLNSAYKRLDDMFKDISERLTGPHPDFNLEQRRTLQKTSWQEVAQNVVVSLVASAQKWVLHAIFARWAGLAFKGKQHRHVLYSLHDWLSQHDSSKCHLSFLAWACATKRYTQGQSRLHVILLGWAHIASNSRSHTKKITSVDCVLVDAPKKQSCITIAPDAPAEVLASLRAELAEARDEIKSLDWKLSETSVGSTEETVRLSSGKTLSEVNPMREQEKLLRAEVANLRFANSECQSEFRPFREREKMLRSEVENLRWANSENREQSARLTQVQSEVYPHRSTVRSVSFTEKEQLLRSEVANLRSALTTADVQSKEQEQVLRCEIVNLRSALAEADTQESVTPWYPYLAAAETRDTRHALEVEKLQLEAKRILKAEANRCTDLVEVAVDVQRRAEISQEELLSEAIEARSKMKAIEASAEKTEQSAQHQAESEARCIKELEEAVHEANLRCKKHAEDLNVAELRHNGAELHWEETSRKEQVFIQRARESTVKRFSALWMGTSLRLCFAQWLAAGKAKAARRTQRQLSKTVTALQASSDGLRKRTRRCFNKQLTRSYAGVRWWAFKAWRNLLERARDLATVHAGVQEADAAAWRANNSLRRRWAFITWRSMANLMAGAKMDLDECVRSGKCRRRRGFKMTAEQRRAQILVLAMWRNQHKVLLKNMLMAWQIVTERRDHADEKAAFHQQIKLIGAVKSLLYLWHSKHCVTVLLTALASWRWSSRHNAALRVRVVTSWQAYSLLQNNSALRTAFHGWRWLTRRRVSHMDTILESHNLRYFEVLANSYLARWRIVVRRKQQAFVGICLMWRMHVLALGRTFLVCWKKLCASTKGGRIAAARVSMHRESVLALQQATMQTGSSLPNQRRASSARGQKRASVPGAEVNQLAQRAIELAASYAPGSPAVASGSSRYSVSGGASTKKRGGVHPLASAPRSKLSSADSVQAIYSARALEVSKPPEGDTDTAVGRLALLDVGRHSLGALGGPL